MVTAVYKKTTNLKLHFYSNRPEIANLYREEAESCQIDVNEEEGHHSKENEHQRDENLEPCKGKGQLLDNCTVAT